MPISRTTIAGSIAGAMLLLSAGAAFATPGQATASVNVRSGPGTAYAVVDSLYPGEAVDVQQCRGSWCYVEHSGPDGWVSANYLSTGEDDSAPPPVYYDDQPPPVYYDEPEYLPPPVYYGSPGYIQRSPGHYHRRPPFQHGFPPPNGQSPPPHFHRQPPGVQQGNPGGPGPFGLQPRVNQPRVNQPDPCTIDPSKCRTGGGPFGMH